LKGILCGISSGANAYAAIDLAKKPENRDKRIGCIAPDTAERYIYPQSSFKINQGGGIACLNMKDTAPNRHVGFASKERVDKAMATLIARVCNGLFTPDQNVVFCISEGSPPSMFTRIN